ncbi:MULTISPECIES: hypothetical protein [Pantoea]|uniref:hypothetical protein n=1 Tax=Pantoea TaxID=53335 RepID=UPI002892E92C|nr:hypothetical protein [Pantoea sp. UBA5923]
MPDYRFYKKGQKVVALKSADAPGAALLLKQGYEKQREEICATNENHALTRFMDIRRENRIDQHNFLAGAGTMPFIGVMTAIAAFLLRKK